MGTCQELNKRLDIHSICKQDERYNDETGLFSIITMCSIYCIHPVAFWTIDVRCRAARMDNMIYELDVARELKINLLLHDIRILNESVKG